MRIYLVSVLPEVFDSFLSTGLVARGLANDHFAIERINPRDFATDKHKTIDDTPYGGGSGMVMMPGPVLDALEAAERYELEAGQQRPLRIYLSAQGQPLTQAIVRDLATRSSLTLLSGRYEGIDERAVNACDMQISLGDFVLMGGEVAAMALVEAVTRLLPGVLGNPDSIVEESHSAGRLEYPQFTRPATFRGQGVPEVLISGDHAKIAAWRKLEALDRTRRLRPDLLISHPETDEERRLQSKISRGKKP